MAAALALLGVALYAALLPWHLTSQFDAQLFKAEFGTLADAMCGSGPASGPADPGAPETGCPICKGLAAFQLALAPAPQTALDAPLAGAPASLAVRDHVADAFLPAPRSRGPPLPA